MKKLKITNEKYLDEIIQNFKKDGKNNIHILADFDRTLTKSFYKGEKKPSIISILRKEGYLGEEYSKKAYELYDKYYPIEVDPNIKLNIKKEKMSQWRNAHLDLLVKSGLHKKDIDKVINSGIIKLRGGIKKFLKKLNKNNIPLIIISANGLGGDSIRLYLENLDLYFPNIFIISNNFVFDNNGNVTGYDKNVIHVFNKDETVLHNYPDIYEKIKNRKNVILLGDSTGDVGMIKGFNYNNLIKIGFLNENEDELLNHYQEIYDLVSTGDSDAKFLNELLDDILN